MWRHRNPADKTWRHLKKFHCCPSGTAQIPADLPGHGLPFCQQCHHGGPTPGDPTRNCGCRFQPRNCHRVISSHSWGAHGYQQPLFEGDHCGELKIGQNHGEKKRRPKTASGGRGDEHEGNKSNGPFYCFCFGSGVWHYIRTCWSKNPGHKDEATKKNKMGGSMATFKTE